MSRLLAASVAQVRLTSRGEPDLLVMPGGRQLAVARCCNHWRVQVDWWRKPLERDYWRLLLTDGTVCEVFCDLAQGEWCLERVYD